MVMGGIRCAGLSLFALRRWPKSAATAHAGHGMKHVAGHTRGCAYYFGEPPLRLHLEHSQNGEYFELKCYLALPMCLRYVRRRFIFGSGLCHKAGRQARQAQGENRELGEGRLLLGRGSIDCRRQLPAAMKKRKQNFSRCILKASFSSSSLFDRLPAAMKKRKQYYSRTMHPESIFLEFIFVRSTV